MKTGIVQPNGLQFTMRAEVHLKAKELGIEIKTIAHVSRIEGLLEAEAARDKAQEHYDECVKVVERRREQLMAYARGFVFGENLRKDEGVIDE